MIPTRPWIFLPSCLVVLANTHASMRKFTVKANPSPWLTDYIRDLMKIRDMAKLEVKKSGFPSDWAVYRKLRNYMVKANRESRRKYV